MADPLAPICLSCGYDLSGLPTHVEDVVCPECGTVRDQEARLRGMGRPAARLDAMVLRAIVGFSVAGLFSGPHLALLFGTSGAGPGLWVTLAAPFGLALALWPSALVAPGGQPLRSVMLYAALMPWFVVGPAMIVLAALLAQVLGKLVLMIGMPVVVVLALTGWQTRWRLLSMEWGITRDGKMGVVLAAGLVVIIGGPIASIGMALAMR